MPKSVKSFSLAKKNSGSKIVQAAPQCSGHPLYLLLASAKFEFISNHPLSDKNNQDERTITLFTKYNTIVETLKRGIMAVIYIYNPVSNNVERYYRGEGQPMPYNIGGTLTVGEFRGSSRSNVLWTDRRAMDSWNVLRRLWGQNIYLGYAFKRIWEGGHAPQSQHYAGMAFDAGQNLNPISRNALRNLAINSGVWSYVEPAYLTPTWVHFDRRLGPPACQGGGYPALRLGSKGVYVLILQDALNSLGYTGSGLDGVFGPGTQGAVARFQRDRGLTPDGFVGCATWQALTNEATGIGLTSSVVNP